MLRGMQDSCLLVRSLTHDDIHLPYAAVPGACKGPRGTSSSC